MKKPALFFTAVALASQAFAQKVSYKILQDDPQNFHPKLSINLLIGGIEMGVKNIQGTNVYVGAFGHYLLNDRLGLQFNAGYSLLTLGRLGYPDYPVSKQLNAGAMYLLSKSVKSKQIKVILKIERGTNRDGREVQTTTYLMVPGTRQVYNGVRGGLYYKGGAFGFHEQKNASLDALGFENASLNSMGVYAGLMHRALTNLIIKTDKYDKCMNSLGVDVYLDALIVPVNSFTLLNTPGFGSTGAFKPDNNITDEVNKYIKSSPIGFRIGWSGFQISPKSVTGKKFGMCYNFEGGLLPYQGWFIRGGVGITLAKRSITPPATK